MPVKPSYTLSDKIQSLPLRVDDFQIRLFRFGPSVEVATYELTVLPLALEDFDTEFGGLKTHHGFDKHT